MNDTTNSTLNNIGRHLERTIVAVVSGSLMRIPLPLHPLMVQCATLASPPLCTSTPVPKLILPHETEQ